MWNNKGKFQLVTKDEGYGIMILDFKYKESCFVYPLTVPDLQTIIEYITIQPKYVDTDTATTTLGHTNKEPITMVINIFYQELEYGDIAKRYCTYERMVLHLYDFTNILNYLYPGTDLIFLFDHTCRNGREREYSLNVTNMNSGYGGAKLKMHPININQEVGYLGPNEKII